MDTLTFISKLIEHALWPALVVGLVIYLLRNIDTIARSLKSVKVRDVEFNFRDELQDLKEAAQNASVTIFYPGPERLGFPNPPTWPEASPPPSSPDALRPARSPPPVPSPTPQIGILEQWTQIERLLVDWARRQPARDVRDERNPRVILDRLLAERVIDPDLHGLGTKLLDLRNRVAHAPSGALTPGEEYDFLGVARSVQSRLEQRLNRAEIP